MCSNKELTWNGGYQGASVIKNENISLYDNFYVKSETRVPGLHVNFAGVFV